LQALAFLTAFSALATSGGVLAASALTLQHTAAHRYRFEAYWL
jgi:hypothetical protein